LFAFSDVCISETHGNGRPPSCTAISDVIGLDHEPYSAIFTLSFSSDTLQEIQADQEAVEKLSQ
jgi:hypothetical protein